MATAPEVPDFPQFDFKEKDTTQIIIKDNGRNAALKRFGNSLKVMTDSINIDLETMEAQKSETQQAAQAGNESAQQVAADKQAVASDRQHVDQQKQAIDTTAGQVNDHARQVAEDRTAVAQNTQTATQAASAAGDAASASIKAKDDAEALYGDLAAVDTAKTEAQQAAATAGEERGAAAQARQGAVEAQGAAETAATQSQQAASAAVKSHVEGDDPHTQYEQKTALKPAAYRDVTESVADSTPGRLLQVGDARVGVSSAFIGRSYKGLALPSTPAGSAWFMPLGLADDPKFRLHGTFCGGRSTDFNTGERWAQLTVDHANRSNGAEPNTQWILRQQGFGARLSVESRIWEGRRWIGITQSETDQNVWQSTLAFDGYMSHIPTGWVRLTDTSSPLQTASYGPSTWEFQGRSVYHQGNILGNVSHLNGIPTGAIIEKDSNDFGSYIKFAGGLAVALREEIVFDSSAVGITKDYRMPAAFLGGRCFVDVSTRFSGTSAMYTTGNLVVGNAGDTWRVRLREAGPDASVAINLFAIGLHA